MRSEQEMYELILGVAKNDDRILGVYLNGSRAKSDAPKDLFQDGNRIDLHIQVL